MRYPGVPGSAVGPIASGVLGILGVLAVACSAAADEPKLASYQTKYYTLYTNLDEDGAREAVLRITQMAEEYHQRTRDFAGSVRERLPFYLFADRSTYEAAGGQSGTAGVFTGDKLMAVVHPADLDATWHAVQHEGFHQFMYASVGRGIPVWANEGLAEYFGDGVWTGDQFVVGLIPPGRLAALNADIAGKRLKPLSDMMRTHHEVWNAELKAENYVQAWAMVYFLAHADNGRYQGAFTAFLHDVSRKTDWEKAWAKNFGSDVNAFQQRWEEYWTKLPDDPTADLYAETVVLTMTSFYARALSQRQSFEAADDFYRAAAAGELKAHKQDWLPRSLLDHALRRVPQVGAWSLEHQSGRRLLVCKTTSGLVLEGSFRQDGSRVKSVSVRPRKERR